MRRPRPQPALEPRTRRSPVQGRSAETVKRISDAASRLLGQKISVEELTTSQIAAEAGVSIGALYRFFPDKQAIVDELAVRRLAEFEALLTAKLIPALGTADGPQLLSTVIDLFVAFLEKHSDFRTIAYGGRHISRATREEHSGANSGAAVLIRQYMTQVLRIPDSADLQLRLRVSIEAGDRLLAFALEQTTVESRRRVVIEMKSLLSGYLFTRVPK